MSPDELEPPQAPSRPLWLLALLLAFACLLFFLVGLLPAVGVPLALVLPGAGVCVALSWLFLLRPLLAEMAVLRWQAVETSDLYNRAPCGYHSLDAQGRFVRINDTALAWLGHSREELLGRHFRDLLAPANRADFDARFPIFCRPGGEVRDLELRLVRKDGSLLPVLLSSVAVTAEDGTFLHSRSTFIDQTALLEAYEGLRQARDEAERANSAKSEFVAVISHEARTSLSGILGLAEVMSHGPLDEGQARNLAALVGAAQGMLSLLNDLLDLSKVEAGRLELETAEVRLEELLAEVAGLLAPEAEGKGLRLRWQLSGGVGPVLGDPARMRQVMLNLVGNAVKFTEKGEVELLATGVRVAGGWRVTFQVRDTGVGIPEAQLLRIFEPFAQGGPGTSRHKGGTGLGLAISSRLVARMGGQLQVASEVGVGSTFAFTLTLPAAATRQGLQAPAEQGRRDAATGHGTIRRVLVAEDNQIMREVLEQQLRRLGVAEVRVAEDGGEVVGLLEAEPFDLVLMDLQMPTVDGLRATRLIRAREKAVGGHTPIIAVTANAMQGERERCLAAGMDGYLTKPVRQDELAEALGRCVGREVDGGPAREAAGATDWTAGLGALGFDDESIRRMGKAFLETAPGRAEALREAMRGRNAPQVAQAAHSLKSTFLVFGEREGSAVAAELERLAGAGRLEGAEAQVSRLEERVAALGAQITAQLADFP